MDIQRLKLLSLFSCSFSLLPSLYPITTWGSIRRNNSRIHRAGKQFPISKGHLTIIGRGPRSSNPQKTTSVLFPHKLLLPNTATWFPFCVSTDNPHSSYAFVTGFLCSTGCPGTGSINHECGIKSKYHHNPADEPHSY